MARDRFNAARGYAVSMSDSPNAAECPLPLKSTRSARSVLIDTGVAADGSMNPAAYARGDTK